MWEILGSAVIGAFSSLFGAKSTEDATKANAEATLAATKNTNAMLQRQYDQNRKDNESWRLAGEEALKKIQSDPGFQFVSEDFDFLVILVMNLENKRALMHLIEVPLLVVIFYLVHKIKLLQDMPVI